MIEKSDNTENIEVPKEGKLTAFVNCKCGAKMPVMRGINENLEIHLKEGNSFGLSCTSCGASLNISLEVSADVAG